MKKTFVVEFDFTPGADKISESFGIDIEDFGLLMQEEGKIAIANSDTNVSDIFVTLIEKDLISSGQLLHLACSKLLDMKKDFVKFVLSKTIEDL